MLTFRKYQPYDRAAYYAPCLPEALAYLPVFENRGPLTLSQVSERVRDFGLAADMRDVAYAVALLADAGYLETDWAACTPPAPAWDNWPAERGLSELIRCGLAQRLAALIAPRYQGRTFGSLVYDIEAGWAHNDMAEIHGFSYSSYCALRNVVQSWRVQYGGQL